MWFQPLAGSRIKIYNECKHTTIEKLNVTNIKNSYSDREDVKKHDLYAHGNSWQP